MNFDLNIENYATEELIQMFDENDVFPDTDRDDNDDYYDDYGYDDEDDY